MSKEIIRTISGHKYKYLVYWDSAKKKRVQKSLGRILDEQDHPPADLKAVDVKITESVDHPDIEETEAEKDIFNKGYEKGLDDAETEYREKINDMKNQHVEVLKQAQEAEYNRGNEAEREYWYQLGRDEAVQKYNTEYQTMVNDLQSKYNAGVNMLEQDKAKVIAMIKEAKKYFADAERILEEAKTLLNENQKIHEIAELTKKEYLIQRIPHSH